MKIGNYKIDFEVAGHGSVSATPTFITYESNAIQSAGDIYQFAMNSKPRAGVTATIYPWTFTTKNPFSGARDVQMRWLGIYGSYTEGSFDGTMSINYEDSERENETHYGVSDGPERTFAIGTTADWLFPVSDKIELGPQIRLGYVKRNGIVAYDPISVDTTGGCTTNAMGITDSADCELGTGYHVLIYNDNLLDLSFFLEGRANDFVGPLDPVFRVGAQLMIPQEDTRSVDVSGVAEIGVAI